jgi:hypothetical protein
MGILRRWYNRFRWRYWHELSQRWHCWRHKVIPLAEAVCVRSIAVGSVEQLTGSVPGIAFNETNSSSNHFRCCRVQPGVEISIEVENLTDRPVPVQGALFALENGWVSNIYPLTPLVLLGRQKGSFHVRVTTAAQLQRLFIPTYVRRP